MNCLLVAWLLGCPPKKNTVCQKKIGKRKKKRKRTATPYNVMIIMIIMMISYMSIRFFGLVLMYSVIYNYHLIFTYRSRPFFCSFFQPSPRYTSKGWSKLWPKVKLWRAFGNLIISRDWLKLCPNVKDWSDSGNCTLLKPEVKGWFGKLKHEVGIRSPWIRWFALFKLSETQV